MDLITLFEYPLPILTLDIDNINIETSSGYEGSFTVKNTGGGNLEGRILSNSRAVKFSPENFSGKVSTIFYSIDLDIYKPGDVINTEAIIMSSGGEATLPVTIKILPFCLETHEGITITDLDDFYSYAKDYPIPARQLFLSQDFFIWLLSISYPHMSAYENLAKDPSKERALDNFFVLNNQKKPAYMQPVEKTISVTLTNDSIVKERITFHKSGKGYLEQKIETLREVTWLRLEKNLLLSSDFDENNTAYLSIYINPNLISQKTCCEEIVTGNYSIKVMVMKSPSISVSLTKEVLVPGETGHIIINNYTGKDLMIDITPDDPTLKFEGKRYSISSYAKIPFEVKIPPLQLAQLGFRKQPFIITYISVSSRELGFFQKKKLTIGL